MVKSKMTSKKQQKRGVDFKKIKRKIGRKLPPPKNSTNTEIKSKAIILPEQSVASDKAGLALSKKGLTLKELLQQTSHYNPKVRKDALIGIKDILLKYPAELKLHKLAVIEKLRERISDDDKATRETLYQLFKSVVFPAFKEDNQGPFISLMMAYVFSAMTHLAIDIRLMAFKFFDLCVQFYPSSFLLHAEKILQNYEDILRKNQFYLQDKGKLKSALAGLARCLSLLPCTKRKDRSSCEKEFCNQEILHAFEPEAPKDFQELAMTKKRLKELLPILVTCFQDFIPVVCSSPLLDAKSFDCMLCIVHSIELIVKFFVHWIHEIPKESPKAPPTHARKDVTLWDQTLSPALLKKLWDVFPLNTTRHLSNKDDDRYFILNTTITEIFLQISDSIIPPMNLLEKFLEFIEVALSEKMPGVTSSGKVSFDRQLIPLICFIPKLVLQLAGDWKFRVLQAFTVLFKNCNPESSLKLACLSALEEMLIPQKGIFYLDARDPEVLEYLITWIRELPQLLMQLTDKHPSCSKAALKILLHLGQSTSLNSPLSQEFDNMQYLLGEFYGPRLDEGSICNSPFLRLTSDVQELSICCLYYFSFLDPILLQSLVRSCLSPNLEPDLLFRILDILHSAYKGGNVHVADYISFLITLVSRFKIFPEYNNTLFAKDERSNRETFRSLTRVVSSLLSAIGDDHLVFQIIEKAMLDQISLKPSIDVTCALLRVLVKLDSTPTKLSDQSVIKLSTFLPQYLLDVASSIPEDNNGSADSSSISGEHYYLVPCYFLFYRSVNLLSLVLNAMGSLVEEKGDSTLLFCHSNPKVIDRTSEITLIVSVLLLMCNDAKVRRILLSCKKEVDRILHNIHKLQSSVEIEMSIEDRHALQRAVNRLSDTTSTLFSAFLA